MGNHEYCVECGENDYHYGQPCDPKKVAKMKREQADREHKQKAREKWESDCIKAMKGISDPIRFVTAAKKHVMMARDYTLCMEISNFRDKYGINQDMSPKRAMNQQIDEVFESLKEKDA